MPKYRPAPLPKDDIKIVIRPRDGLSVANHSGTILFNALRQAAGLTLEETRGDHLSVNLVQNLLVLSSPNPDRAEKYAHITSLTLEDAVFSARGYIACPENTVKGVIHGIPPNHSAADIHAAVVQPCNPTALHARRMGQTNTVLVSFSGSRVPHYIDYQGTVTRCYIHKRKHEVCSACGKLGHRADVCPYPDRAYCAACGLANPMEEHECIIKCALCGLAHPTGDAVCQLRYRTPFVLRQRQQRRARSRSRKRKDDPHHNRDRTGSFPRLPSDSSAPASEPTTQSTVQRRRSRSKSKRSGSQPPPPATSASSDQRPSSQVSWAAVASPNHEQPPRTPALSVRHSSSNPPPPSSELAYLRTLLESVVATQRQLQADVKQLQQAIRTPPPSQCSSQLTAPRVMSASQPILPTPPKRRSGDTTTETYSTVSDLRALEEKFDAANTARCKELTALASQLADIKASVATTQNMIATMNTKIANVLPTDAPVRAKTAGPGPTRHTPYTRIPVTLVSVNNGESSAVSSSPATPSPSKPV